MISPADKGFSPIFIGILPTFTAIICESVQSPGSNSFMKLFFPLTTSKVAFSNSLHLMSPLSCWPWQWAGNSPRAFLVEGEAVPEGKAKPAQAAQEHQLRAWPLLPALTAKGPVPCRAVVSRPDHCSSVPTSWQILPGWEPLTDSLSLDTYVLSLYFSIMPTLLMLYFPVKTL